MDMTVVNDVCNMENGWVRLFCLIYRLLWDLIKNLLIKQMLNTMLEHPLSHSWNVAWSVVSLWITCMWCALDLFGVWSICGCMDLCLVDCLKALCLQFQRNRFSCNLIFRESFHIDLDHWASINSGRPQNSSVLALYWTCCVERLIEIWSLQ